MPDIVRLFVFYLSVMNIIAFVLYGIDKQKARNHTWRIPENALLGCAVCGGAIGAWAGMWIFHHKTRHVIFRVLVPLCFVIWVGIAVLVFVKAN